ncbi:class I SAM-dependent methyltransferase [Verrucomicrobium spinosum]|uniref:class I SAM-dependent methyltransferase n=1 Tax=Verrucomicrobium spinosum TaxID=2736 RepID=UPI001C460696|nr:class I SAM-dependent methyltransferase [Verrucomicrobium spinosum]
MLGIRQLPKLALEAFVIRRYRGIEGWFTWKEALSLYELAKALPSNSTVVEIGSWKGRSTYCLAQGLKDGSVHAIDRLMDRARKAARRPMSGKPARATCMRGSASG